MATTLPKLPQEIIDPILRIQAPALIGISGFGGAGKSTFAKTLGESVCAPVVGIDSFIRDRNLKDYCLWEWMDFKRLEEEVMTPFTQGMNPISYGHFDWNKNAVAETRSLSHQGRLIVEGVGLFRPTLMKYFSCKIWVDCPLEEAIARGKKRDLEINQSSQEENWDGIWKKNDLEYFSAFHPQEAADFVWRNF